MLTEKEKIQRARRYMYKLSKGINPINNEFAGEDSVVANDRLKRCFEYIFELLGRDIRVMEEEEKASGKAY